MGGSLTAATYLQRKSNVDGVVQWLKSLVQFLWVTVLISNLCLSLSVCVLEFLCVWICLLVCSVCDALFSIAMAEREFGCSTGVDRGAGGGVGRGRGDKEPCLLRSCENKS